MLTDAGNQDMLTRRNLSAFIALNPLIQVKAQAIFHIASCIQNSYGTSTVPEIIILDLLDVTGNLAA